MAKLLIFLAGLIVVLNGMTFFLVVELEGQPEAGKGPAGDLQLQQLDSLAPSLKQANRSISQISKKLSDLEREVTGLGTLKTESLGRSSRLKHSKQPSSAKRPAQNADVGNEADEDSSDRQSDAVPEGTEGTKTEE